MLRAALLAHQLVDDLLGNIVFPIAPGVPAPRADRVALLDQRRDFALDLGAVALAIGLFEVKHVQPVPNLGQPSAFLGREWRDRGGHVPLFYPFSDLSTLTQLAEEWVKMSKKVACFQSPTARTGSRAPASWRRISRA